MSLDLEQLATSMAGAFTQSLGQQAPQIADYARSEARKLAQTLQLIAELAATGTLSEEEARLHLDIQKNATRTVFLTIQGLGALAVENAINAALGVVRETVNSALKFSLL